MRFTVGRQGPPASSRRAGAEPQPLHDGDRILDPRAVRGRDVARGAALPASKLGRQTFRAHEANVAACAGDLEHHGVAPKKPRRSPGLKFA